MKLSALCSYLNKYNTFDFIEKEICGITHDSRNVKADYIFVAIKGYKLDGHDFVNSSIEEGAVAIVSERRVETPKKVPQIIVNNTRLALAFMSRQFFGDPSSKMTITGITGTNGKTTTSYFTKSIIEASGYEAGLIGTIQYQIGNRRIPAQETTPESVDIMNYLSEMLKSNIRHAVIEASSHAISQHRLDGVRFDSIIFTNLSAEHLDYHENITNYRAEKIKLVNKLEQNAFTILNADHNASKYFAECTKSKVIWYGIKRKEADVIAEILNVSACATKFLLNSPWGKEIIDLKLVGKHNTYNALAAAANGLSLGFKIEDVKKGIESLSAVPGRLEKINYGQNFDIYIDFAHTHQALQVILITLREITKGRIILVFGCGGDRDRKKRPKMGYIAEKYSDLFWITNDNPRSEDPLCIIHEIQKGIKKDASFRIQPDRKVAIEEAIAEAKKGDTLIIAGKGHEKYQITKNKRYTFDDREVVKQFLGSALVQSY